MTVIDEKKAEEDLKALVAGISDFASWTPTKRITLFAWVQHSIRGLERFESFDIGWCFEKLNLRKPNIAQTLHRMEKDELLRDGSGYYMEGGVRAEYQNLFGEHDITIQIRHMVKELINVIPELGEKDIFDEAMICLRHNAGRAAEIMVWNIAMYHLYQFILKHHLKEFNDRMPVRFPKKWKVTDLPVIEKYDDFGDNMSEREILDVASSAGIINDGIYKIYKNRLDQRNSAAHPSTLRVTQVQAEGFIDDLIRNTVLQLKI